MMEKKSYSSKQITCKSDARDIIKQVHDGMFPKEEVVI